jgi:hypothetical protein
MEDGVGDRGGELQAGSVKYLRIKMKRSGVIAFLHK